MGIHYNALLFYGIILDEREYSPSGFLKEYEVLDASKEDMEAEWFDEDEWYAGDEWDRGVGRVSSHWASEGDPVCIGRISEYDNLGPPYLGIRETAISTEWYDSFDLKLDYEKWDKALKQKCEKYGISWTQPQFHFVIEVS